MEPFLGQISVVAFNYAPRGWALCNGQVLPIAQNQALFSLLGTAYGGDGRVTFALPDLRGRAATHYSNANPPGATGGAEKVQLNTTQIPPHVHMPQANSAAATLAPAANNVWAASPAEAFQYSPLTAADAVMSPAASGSAGGNQPHDNMPPVLVLNFIIALEGIWPSRN
jgi:microcystin-dependent protein